MRLRFAIAVLLAVLVGFNLSTHPAQAQETGNPPVTVIPIPGLEEPEEPPRDVETPAEPIPRDNVQPPAEPAAPPTTVAPAVDPRTESVDGDALTWVGLVGAAMVLLGLAAMWLHNRRKRRDQEGTVPVRLPAMTQALQPPHSNHPFEVLRADFIGGEEKEPVLHHVSRFSGYDAASERVHMLRREWSPRSQNDVAWWVIRSEITGLIVLITRSDRDEPPDWVANARLQERLSNIEPGARLKRAT